MVKKKYLFMMACTLRYKNNVYHLAFNLNNIQYLSKNNYLFYV